MNSMIYVGVNSQNQVEYRREPKRESGGKSTSFLERAIELEKERALERALSEKSPKEMTLEEYRRYVKEKVDKNIVPFCGGEAAVSVEFSDMALVMMKNDPELEEMVLKGVWHELRKEVGQRRRSCNTNIRVCHERERRAEEEKNLQRRRLRKKMLVIWLESREEQRENYAEFLKTGERYVLPCPAVEMLKAVRSMGSFLGL